MWHVASMCSMCSMWQWTWRQTCWTRGNCKTTILTRIIIKMALIWQMGADAAKFLLTLILSLCIIQESHNSAPIFPKISTAVTNVFQCIQLLLFMHGIQTSCPQIFFTSLKYIWIRSQEIMKEVESWDERNQYRYIFSSPNKYLNKFNAVRVFHAAPTHCETLCLNCQLCRSAISCVHKYSHARMHTSYHASFHASYASMR